MTILGLFEQYVKSATKIVFGSVDKQCFAIEDVVNSKVVELHTVQSFLQAKKASQDTISVISLHYDINSALPTEDELGDGLRRIDTVSLATISKQIDLYADAKMAMHKAKQALYEVFDMLPTMPLDASRDKRDNFALVQFVREGSAFHTALSNIANLNRTQTHSLLNMLVSLHELRNVKQTDLNRASNVLIPGVAKNLSYVPQSDQRPRGDKKAQLGVEAAGSGSSAAASASAGAAASAGADAGAAASASAGAEAAALPVPLPAPPTALPLTDRPIQGRIRKRLSVDLVLPLTEEQAKSKRPRVDASQEIVGQYLERLPQNSNLTFEMLKTISDEAVDTSGADAEVTAEFLWNQDFRNLVGSSSTPRPLNEVPDAQKLHYENRARFFHIDRQTEDFVARVTEAGNIAQYGPLVQLQVALMKSFPSKASQRAAGFLCKELQNALIGTKLSTYGTNAKPLIPVLDRIIYDDEKVDDCFDLAYCPRRVGYDSLSSVLDDTKAQESYTPLYRDKRQNLYVIIEEFLTKDIPLLSHKPSYIDVTAQLLAEVETAVLRYVYDGLEQTDETDRLKDFVKIYHEYFEDALRYDARLYEKILSSAEYKRVSKLPRGVSNELSKKLATYEKHKAEYRSVDSTTTDTIFGNQVLRRMQHAYVQLPDFLTKHMALATVVWRRYQLALVIQRELSNDLLGNNFTYTDPTAPEKPQTAFQFWRHRVLTAENSNQEWKSMTAEQKAPYTALAATEKDRYNTQLQAYLAQNPELQRVYSVPKKSSRSRKSSAATRDKVKSYPDYMLSWFASHYGRQYNQSDDTDADLMKTLTDAAKTEMGKTLIAEFKKKSDVLRKAEYVFRSSTAKATRKWKKFHQRNQRRKLFDEIINSVVPDTSWKGFNLRKLSQSIETQLRKRDPDYELTALERDYLKDKLLQEMYNKTIKNILPKLQGEHPVSTNIKFKDIEELIVRERNGKQIPKQHKKMYLTREKLLELIQQHSKTTGAFFEEASSSSSSGSSSGSGSDSSASSSSGRGSEDEDEDEDEGAGAASNTGVSTDDEEFAEELEKQEQAALDTGLVIDSLRLRF